ncbi:hypothetical protein [Neisseria lactamica]|nr:hypothetical protein [Neisseria lactamica]
MKEALTEKRVSTAPQGGTYCTLWKDINRFNAAKSLVNFQFIENKT